MRYYLSGQMSGLADKGIPIFAAAAKAIRALGHDVWNPGEQDDSSIELEAASHPEDPKWAWRQFLKRDIKALMDCDAVAVLPSWRKSEGATFEVESARKVGLPIVDAYTLQPVEEETVTAEADRIVSGDRNSFYGPPYYDFKRTGRMWGAILNLDRDIQPYEVGLCMVALKVSREVNKRKRDNMVDTAGYAKCVDLCNQEQEILEKAKRHRVNP